MDTPEEPDHRLSGLHARPEQKNFSKGYSAFIRAMRLVLPLIAIIIVTLIFVWPEMEDTIEPLAREQILPDVPSAQNELLKPRYESLDKDQQPFTITAEKAAQDQNNPELILLDKPTADMLMKDGTWLAAKADNAIYEQNAEKLQLNGNVHLFHDAGYQLETEELRVNLDTQEAFSDQDVQAQGPEGTINSIGLEAYGVDNIVIFKGPAKMLLNTSGSAMNLGKTMP